jgi:hypothetical protein
MELGGVFHAQSQYVSVESDELVAALKICVPSLYTLYPTTATLSVDFDQVRFMAYQVDTWVAVRLVGVEGAVVSMVDVVVVAVGFDKGDGEGDGVGEGVRLAENVGVGDGEGTGVLEEDGVGENDGDGVVPEGGGADTVDVAVVVAPTGVAGTVVVPVCPTGCAGIVPEGMRMGGACSRIGEGNSVVVVPNFL